MAIDTAGKRQAALNRGKHRTIAPDGTIGDQDRAWLLLKYYAGVAAAFIPTAGQWAANVVVKPLWQSVVAIKPLWQVKVK